jgi:hypothetical protein
MQEQQQLLQQHQADARGVRKPTAARLRKAVTASFFMV